MKRLFSIVLLFSVWQSLFCQNEQSFDESRKSMWSGMASFREDVISDYKSFRRQINSDYANFLKEIWRDFLPEPAPEPIKEPVPSPPVVMPEEEKDKNIEKQPVIIKDKILPTPSPDPQPQPVVPIEEEYAKPTNPPFYFQFVYYGTSLKVRLSDKHRFKLKSINPGDLGDAWNLLSEDRYNNLISDCLKIREEYTLCDWAYLQMLSKMSDSFLGKNTNESVFLTAFLFCQSGYRMRLGVNQNQLYLLVGTPNQLFGRGYFIVDGLNYFVHNGNPSKCSICAVEFKGEKSLSLSIPFLPRLKETLSSNRVLGSKKYYDITVNSQVNKNIIDFFNDYPTSVYGNNILSRLALYAETPVCTPAERSVIDIISAKLRGVPESSALNILLNFVQTAFVYEYDDKVWGGDRAFFADETLFYPFSDCEDRSILFSRLVRNILGLQVCLVYYPGHLATAVKVKTEIPGDYLVINNNEYFLVCDPTYIGAPAGRTMPDMDNNEVKIIILN